MVVATDLPHSPRWPWNRTAGALLLLLLCGSFQAGDWSQWRGPDGSGVSGETGLPVELDIDSPALLWKTEVRGEGISSPIVSNGRVFLTTAYPGQEQSRARTLKFVGLPALALLVLLTGTLALRRGAPTSVKPGRLLELDALATRTVTLAFLPAALLAAFVPRLFPAWAEGVFGWGWFYTGGIALAGLAAALGWLPPRSPWRLLGVLALLGAALYLHRNIGLNSYGQSFKQRERWIMVLPALGGAMWHAGILLLARRLGSIGHAPGSRSALAWGSITGGSMAAMAAFLFVTVNLWEPRAGLMRAVLCFDLASGKELWDTPLFVAPKEQKYDMNSFATPTPCTDGTYLFAYFGSGWACLDHDGRVLWQGRDDQYAANTRYGCGSSPVRFEDTFIVLQEKEYVRPSYIVAFEKTTGRERWRVNPRYASDSYATPLVVRREGSSELVTASAERAVAHDPRNGELLWSVALPIRQMVPSPCYSGDLLLIAGGTHTKTSASGIRLSGTGASTQAEVVWQTNKYVPTVSSPVLLDGSFFGVTSAGILTCSDPSSGEVRWKERLQGSIYWASLVAGDGKVYAVDEEGVIQVVAAKAQYELLGAGALGEGCYATPALAAGRVLVRGTKHLFCFKKPAS